MGELAGEAMGAVERSDAAIVRRMCDSVESVADTTQAVFLLAYVSTLIVMSQEHTRTAQPPAPLLFFCQKALQAQECSSSFSRESQLQIFAPLGAQRGFGECRGPSEQSDDGHDERMEDIAVKEPCLSRLSIALAVVGAEAAGALAINPSTNCAQLGLR
jgi:hypothetical protein